MQSKLVLISTLCSLAVVAMMVVIYSCANSKPTCRDSVIQQIEKQLPIKLCEISESKANPFVTQSDYILANFIKKFPEVVANQKAGITNFQDGFGWSISLTMIPASPGGHSFYHVNPECDIVDITRGV